MVVGAHDSCWRLLAEIVVGSVGLEVPMGQTRRYRSGVCIERVRNKGL